MSYAFTNRAHLKFEPGRSLAFLIDAIAAAIYGTPADLVLKLGDLARLQFLRAQLKYSLTLDAAAASGQLVVKVLNGATVLGQQTINLAGAPTRYHGVFDVDLSAVTSTSTLTVSVQVVVAAPAGRSAQIDAVLDVEHPIVIAG